MTSLRRRQKGLENLRLANVRDYIITEDEPELSPRTTRPPFTRLVPRRLNDDTYEDIMNSFGRFTWDNPNGEAVNLWTYRKFSRAVEIPTREAIVPWVDWLVIQLGWEREWILENLMAAKKEIMRRFKSGTTKRSSVIRPLTEVFDIASSDDEPTEVDRDEMRGGAVARLGFRRGETPNEKPPHHRGRLRKRETPARPISTLGIRGKKDVGEKRSTSAMRKLASVRPGSALGFREVKAFGGKIMRKALTNPWQRREKE